MPLITEFRRHLSLNMFVDFVKKKDQKLSSSRLHSINNTHVVSIQYIRLLNIIFLRLLSVQKKKAFADKNNIKSVLSGPLIRHYKNTSSFKT